MDLTDGTSVSRIDLRGLARGCGSEDTDCVDKRAKLRRVCGIAVTNESESPSACRPSPPGRTLPWCHGVGLFRKSGDGHLRRLDSTATREKYHSVHQIHTAPSALHHCGERFTRQQGSDHKHLKELQDPLENQGDLTVLLKSPALNPLDRYRTLEN
ncbi:unnamed protein product [Pleuronectes platessa]|uniref:Uncharacterized protein n=1 Tax=Pleuronectes platessa TaxID=8262 RepID=A0A9N7VHA7_PLEPL|nr:unnamed protein product [Pleuronectes platessa]